jgi:predicted O-methyltransferase YrrM
MNTIIKYNLTSGLEIATGFGVSALAAGLGFKQTGGKLLTFDAYIEDYYGHSKAYIGTEHKLYYDTEGYNLARWLQKSFGTEDNVILEIGWSPNDIDKLVNHHAMAPLDYVFLDAKHTDERLLLDFQGIWKHINRDRYIIFIHDITPNEYPNARAEIKRLTGSDIPIANLVGLITDTWGLGIVTNICA